MKKLQLDLNKRLLIVEIPEGKSSEEVLSEYKGDKDVQWDFLCKGSDLTEEILKPFISSGDRLPMNDRFVLGYLDYHTEVIDDVKIYSCLTAIESFISSIEASGYHWGENPLGKKPELTDSRYNEEREFIENNPDELVMGDHYADWSMWQEAESRTFNPSKCIIFEIV